MKLLPIILIIFLFGCNDISINDFDKEIWKNDKNACKNQRASQIDALIAHKNLILGFSQQEVVDLLGRPDKNELYSRGQKFYLYSILPNEFCSSSSSVKTLRIRFNALNSVSEITIDQN